MDETIAKDTSKTWLEVDSLRTEVQAKTKSENNVKSLVTGLSIILGATILLIILFNSRSK
jgi:hypothetical protein